MLSPLHRFLKSFQMEEDFAKRALRFSMETVEGRQTDRGNWIDRIWRCWDVAEKGRFKNLSSGMYLLFCTVIDTKASLKLCGYGSVYDETFQFVGQDH